MINSMNEWEYTVIQVAFEEDWPRVIEHNDRDAGGPLIEPKLHRYLNKLGKDGWEVVGVLREYVVLKRPKVR